MDDYFELEVMKVLMLKNSALAKLIGVDFKQDLRADSESITETDDYEWYGPLYKN
jgi:hypothetical protein